MLIQEMSDQFDVLFNNITSNQAPGLNGYEKSVFLTKAEKETIKNHFTANSRGNSLGQGFDDSAKRQADFSMLMKASQCAAVTLDLGSSTGIVKHYACTVDGATKNLINAQLVFKKNNVPYTIIEGTYTVDIEDGAVSTTIDSEEIIITGWPFDVSSDGEGTLVVTDKEYQIPNGKIDNRSTVYAFPSDVFIVTNESIVTNANRTLQVVPLRFDEYTRLMSKPYKRPLKNQAWRLINSGNVSEGSGTKVVEIIAGAGDTISSYVVRYVRVPRPIIVEDLMGLTIDGESTASTECELDPILHEEVLQRAVELAKIAWSGAGQDVQLEMASGQRSE
jgi:hypothetical protein